MIVFGIVANILVTHNGLRLGVVAEFWHKCTIEEPYLNLPTKCHTKHCTRHYAKPLLGAALLLLSSFVTKFFYHFLYSISLCVLLNVVQS